MTDTRGLGLSLKESLNRRRRRRRPRLLLRQLSPFVLVSNSDRLMRRKSIVPLKSSIGHWSEPNLSQKESGESLTHSTAHIPTKSEQPGIRSEHGLFSPVLVLQGKVGNDRNYSFAERFILRGGKIANYPKNDKCRGKVHSFSPCVGHLLGHIILQCSICSLRILGPVSRNHGDDVAHSDGRCNHSKYLGKGY